MFALMRVRHGWAVVNQGPELAADDFERALQVDRDNPDALIGRAYAKALSGDVASALQDAARAEKRFGDHDPRQLSNVACVYAQAAGRVLAQLDNPDRRKRADEYCQRAVTLIRQALDVFPEAQRAQVFALVHADRAFDPIRTLPPFAELVGQYAGSKP
jgi:tetratricopeptide (TPR) repeat protein